MKPRILIIASAAILISAVWVGHALGIALGTLAPVGFFAVSWMIAALWPRRDDELQGPTTGRVGASRTQMLQAILILGAFPPLLILLHEAGHYLVARGLGYSAELTYAEVLFRPQRFSREDSIAITVAGPMVEFLFACIAIAGLWRCGRSHAKPSGVGLWVFTACATGGFRWLRVTSRGDEIQLCALLGLPSHLLLSLLVLVPILLTILLLRAHRRHQTMIPLAVGFAAAVVSLVTWLTWLGPKVFPKP